AGWKRDAPTVLFTSGRTLLHHDWDPNHSRTKLSGSGFDRSASRGGGERSVRAALLAGQGSNRSAVSVARTRRVDLDLYCRRRKNHEVSLAGRAAHRIRLSAVPAESADR